LTKRIKALIDKISEDDIVLDVGCDMALLGESLARLGINSYASDIRENIVLNAKNRIENLGLSSYITFFVSDGDKNIDVFVDTLVIAGMGTHNILDIISNSNKSYKKIITISNNNHDILRKEMIKFGYYASLEEIIYEKGKYYNLIVFEKGKYKYSKVELIVGINHINKELLKQKNEYLINKYKKVYNESNNESIKELIELIENYKY